MIQVTLQKDLAARLKAGHPWIYRDALSPPAKSIPAGSLVEVRERKGAFVGAGFFDADSPIAVRMLCRSTAPLDVPARISAACRLRRMAELRIGSDAVRLLYGESDFVPGLVLDLYAGTGVVRFDGDAAQAFWQPLLPKVFQVVRENGFTLERAWARPTGRRAGGQSLFGGAPPEEIVIHEGEARFAVDVVHGQKTGFFLDQRDNRRLVAAHSAGAHVLNLFGYTGGFSVRAALAGAQSVTTVDLAAPAIAGARRNFELNGISSGAHRFVAVDVFEFLLAADRRWDVVVCDPPSFAPSEKAKPQALKAYLRLNREAMSAVEPGGLFATASCSSHVSASDLIQIVARAALELGRQARLLSIRGAGPDHPVVPVFPEGQYLKFLLVAID